MANTMPALQALNAVFTKEQAEVLLALLPENYGPAIDALTSRVGSVEGEVEGKADAQHTHAISDITGLADSLSDIEGRLEALENMG